MNLFLKHHTNRLLKNRLVIILNGVKVLELLRKTKFFASLRITKTPPRRLSTAC